ncbi:MAG: hypothetical protein COX57_04225 [Alphaproteobacteria bacterium CG_4_10_14_0_2_um_filter_63_37]|nr:MAG: hypothetical protein AUJ55_07850 [Proteobacteria bacterium CG1_02_64_396]PJA25249.1 MAG: hypothetical protein COX57_04225 [Alphaproteobacteria bacterium CG_4_10_14_0_2_um_filter_63_37]
MTLPPRLLLWPLLALTCWTLVLNGCGDGATEEFKKEKQGQAYQRLGNDYLGKGQFARALQDLLRAEKLMRTDAALHDAIGLCYLGLGKYEEATARFEMALKVDPNYSNAQNNLGTMLMGLGRYDEAIPHFKKALENPFYQTPEMAYANYAWAEYNLKHYPRALELAGTAVQLSQKEDPIARYRMAMVLDALNRRDEAKAAMEMILENAPNFAPALVWLGRDAFNHGDGAAAREYLDKVVAIAPDSLDALTARALLSRLIRTEPFEGGQ